MVKSSTALYLTRLAKINFVFAAVFAIYIIIFDAGNILTREAVYQRWLLEAVLVTVYTLFWVATKKATSKYVLFVSFVACVIAELVLAGLSVYWERGMASMSTVLFILPIASMALSGSRTYTIGTALLASVTYTLASTKYFYDFFNEGYRVQLYGQIFFFSATFLIIGWAIATLAHAYSKK